MKTNRPQNTTTSSQTTIIEKDLSYAIVGSSMQVYNELGFGFVEPAYARSLQILLAARGLLAEREYPIEVLFRGVSVGRHRIDMLVERRIIVEIKSTERLSNVAARQLRNYLSATRLQLGLILHFGPRFEFHRVLAPWVVDSGSSIRPDSSDSDA